MLNAAVRKPYLWDPSTPGAAPPMTTEAATTGPAQIMAVWVPHLNLYDAVQDGTPDKATAAAASLQTEQA